MQNSVRQSGRHFLQVPGPTPIPERILAAMCRQMLDHRSPQFQELAHRVLSGIRTIFRTKGPVILFPSSGTGALEAALVNTLSPGRLRPLHRNGPIRPSVGNFGARSRIAAHRNSN
jgi:alanine-glyoxylate transaminase/serine-glyoxylate transaminase/serine-pyruvate transaminase